MKTRPIFQALAQTAPMANYYMFAEEPLTAIHSVDGNIGYINVKRRLTYETSSYRGISYQRISSALRELESNDQVETIVFMFNSPGGDVTGLTDMMDDIRAVEKTTIAYAVGMCASAAFCMAWQCDRFYASETASVGSFGVITAFYDEKTHLQSLGIPYDEFINDGSEKKRMTFGNEEDTLDTKAELNSIIKAILSRMDATDQSLDFFGNGRTFSGIDAKDRDLIDEVMTMRDLQRNLAADSGQANLKNPAEVQERETPEEQTPTEAQAPMQVNAAAPEAPAEPTPAAGIDTEAVKAVVEQYVAPIQAQLKERDEVIAKLQKENETLNKRTNLAAAVSAQIGQADHVGADGSPITAEAVAAFLLGDDAKKPFMAGVL